MHKVAHPRHKSFLDEALIASHRGRIRRTLPSRLVPEEETREWLLAQGLRLLGDEIEDGTPSTYLFDENARQTCIRKGHPTSFAVLTHGAIYTNSRGEFAYHCRILGDIRYFAHERGHDPVQTARVHCTGNRIILPENIYSAETFMNE